jgi:lysophospholipase L1-like esterase
MKAVLAPVVMALLSVALLLSVVEVGLRMAGYDPIGRLSKGRHLFLRPSSNPDLRYELVPGAEGQAWRRFIKINAHGFRDREYALAKPPGTYRALVIGDSVTFAGALAVDRRFTEVLETRIQAEGRRVEVLNLGVGGYDTLNEVAFLEQVGLAFDPDLVIVAFCINDLGIHSANLDMLRFLQQYGWLVRNLRIAQLFVVRLDRAMLARQFEDLNRDDVFRREHAGRIAPVSNDSDVQGVVREIERLSARGEESSPPPFLEWYTSEAKIGRLRYSFERLRGIADDEDFATLVLIIPYLDEGEHAEAYRQAYDLIAYEAERVGFDVLNLHGPFQRHGFERLGGPLHPNEAGHRLIASELYTAIRAHERHRGETW